MSRITELPSEAAPAAVELRPCPFCGGKAELRCQGDPNSLAGVEYSVVCGDELCDVYIIAGPGHYRHAVIETWNTRKGWKL